MMICKNRTDNKELSRQEREQVEIQVKYEGYIKKQIRQAEQFKNGKQNYS